MKTIACVALMVAVAGCGTEEPDRDPVDAGPPLFPWRCAESQVCSGGEGAVSDTYASEHCLPQRDEPLGDDTPECSRDEVVKNSVPCDDGTESVCVIDCRREYTDRAINRCD